jgi:hypothetical protein
MVAPQAALAGAVVAAALLPFLLPYWRVHHDQGLSRSLDEAGVLAATWGDYLSTPSRLHYGWSSSFSGGSAFFPGFAASGLAAFALLGGTIVRDKRARMACALGLAGLALSFGTHMPGYGTLYRWLPPLQAIRAVSRFGYLALAAIAILAGFGLADVRRRMPRIGSAVGVAALACAIVEPFSAPLELTTFGRIAPIYGLPALRTGAVVVEIPFSTERTGFRQAPYLLNSTLHWRPMLNGYSGFRPASFYENAEALANFPDAIALRTLQARGVTHVFVHMKGIDAEHARMIDDLPELRREAADRDIVLFSLSKRVNTPD